MAVSKNKAARFSTLASLCGLTGAIILSACSPATPNSPESSPSTSPSVSASSQPRTPSNIAKLEAFNAIKNMQKYSFNYEEYVNEGSSRVDEMRELDKHKSRVELSPELKVWYNDELSTKPNFTTENIDNFRGLLVSADDNYTDIPGTTLREWKLDKTVDPDSIGLSCYQDGEWKYLDGKIVFNYQTKQLVSVEYLAETHSFGTKTNTNGDSVITKDNNIPLRCRRVFTFTSIDDKPVQH